MGLEGQNVLGLERHGHRQPEGGRVVRRQHDQDRGRRRQGAGRMGDRRHDGRRGRRHGRGRGRGRGAGRRRHGLVHGDGRVRRRPRDDLLLRDRARLAPERQDRLRQRPGVHGHGDGGGRRDGRRVDAQVRARRARPGGHGGPGLARVEVHDPDARGLGAPGEGPGRGLHPNHLGRRQPASRAGRHDVGASAEMARHGHPAGDPAHRRERTLAADSGLREPDPASPGPRRLLL